MILGTYTIYLNLTHGPKAPQSFQFSKFPILIGKKGCDLILDDTTISEQHAQIAWLDGKFILTDLESQRGIRVNSKQGLRFELKQGDSIEIGAHEFRIEWKQAEFRENILEQRLKDRLAPGTPEQAIEEVFLEEMKQI